MTPRDITTLALIQQYLHKAQLFLGSKTFEEFLTDEKTQYAVALAIVQAGENVKRLSNELRQTTIEKDWKGMAGIRDWIVHEYDAIEYDTLYDAVTIDAPRVIKTISLLLSEVKKSPVQSADNTINSTQYRPKPEAR